MLAVLLSFTTFSITWKILGLLDCDNQLHIWCLHFVYIPYINYALKMFVEAWANHPMSSMRGMTPLQIWTRGMIMSINSGDRITQELFHSETDYVSCVLIILYP